MKREGYIRDYMLEEVSSGSGQIRVELKYSDGEPVIREINVSPSRAAASTRRSRTCREYYNGLGVKILSTPRGVMSDAEARAANVGGEVLCEVF